MEAWMVQAMMLTPSAATITLVWLGFSVFQALHSKKFMVVVSLDM